MRLSVDSKKCVGCEACVIACAAAHSPTGEFNPLRANIRVPFTHPLPSAPVICLQCPKPACVEVCQENALLRKEELGIVLLDRQRCIGCGKCVEVCKFHAIFIDQIDKRARKCDVCGGKPQCKEFCQKEALSIK